MENYNRAVSTSRTMVIVDTVREVVFDSPEGAKRRKEVEEFLLGSSSSENQTSNNRGKRKAANPDAQDPWKLVEKLREQNNALVHEVDDLNEELESLKKKLKRKR